MRQTRHIVVILVVLFVAGFAPAPLLAQSGTLNDFRQTATIDYGHRILFELQASANVPIIGSRLTVEIAGSEVLHSEVVSVEQGVAVDIEHSLTVEQLNLPPAAEFTYFWDLVDANGTEYSTSPVSVTYQDQQVPWDWQPQTDADITVYTGGRSTDAADLLLAIASTALTEAERLLGIRYDGQMTLYLYPDLTSLATALSLHNREFEDWVPAYAIYEQQTVLISAEEGPDMAYNLQRDVPHMVAHLAVSKAAGGQDPIPGWFSEGLALRLATESDPTLRDALSRGISNRDLIALQTLCRPNFSSLTPGRAALAYAQSESLINYIDRRYGSAGLQRVILAVANGAECHDAVAEGLGISLAELESRWHNELMSERNQGSDNDVSLAPWIAVWVVSVGLALLFVAPQPTYQLETIDETTDFDATRPIKTR